MPLRGGEGGRGPRLNVIMMLIFQIQFGSVPLEDNLDSLLFLVAMWLHLLSQVIIDKPLLHRVKVDDSMWSIETGNGCCIYINLEKTKEIMWKSVLEGEQGIDLTKVDTTRNISEFDEEAQAAIQRVTYDHHMKMLGKPTSQEKVRKKLYLL